MSLLSKLINLFLWLRSYKKQIEEAEEIAALNLAKYRQAQGGVVEAEERAELNEKALAQSKTRARSTSLAPMVGQQPQVKLLF